MKALTRNESRIKTRSHGKGVPVSTPLHVQKIAQPSAPQILGQTVCPCDGGCPGCLPVQPKIITSTHNDQSAKKNPQMKHQASESIPDPDYLQRSGKPQTPHSFIVEDNISLMNLAESHYKDPRWWVLPYIYNLDVLKLKAPVNMQSIIQGGTTLEAPPMDLKTALDEITQRMPDIQDKKTYHNVQQGYRVLYDIWLEKSGQTPPKPEALGTKKGKVVGGDPRKARPKRYDIDIQKANTLYSNEIIRKSQSKEAAVATYLMIVDQLDVTKSPRYQKKDESTYCNIFAHDVTQLMGASIPHWKGGEYIVEENTGKEPLTDKPLTLKEFVGKFDYVKDPESHIKGSKVMVDYLPCVDPEMPLAEGQHVRINIEEMRTNPTLEWLLDPERGGKAGWREVEPLDAQKHANQGRPAVVTWHTGVKGKSQPGHIAVIIPEPEQAGRAEKKQYEELRTKKTNKRLANLRNKAIGKLSKGIPDSLEILVEKLKGDPRIKEDPQKQVDLQIKEDFLEKAPKLKDKIVEIYNVQLPVLKEALEAEKKRQPALAEEKYNEVQEKAKIIIPLIKSLQEIFYKRSFYYAKAKHFEKEAEGEGEEKKRPKWPKDLLCMHHLQMLLDYERLEASRMLTWTAQAGYHNVARMVESERRRIPLIAKRYFVHD